MSIKIQGITKIYGKQKALDNINLEIVPGEVVGLLGPNGAGKSTLMKIITCFLTPTEGTIEVYGHSIHDNELEIKKMIGYLPEQNPLYPEMYTVEYLEFIAGIHNIPNKKQRIEEIIELTGLEPEMHKKINALSKGYKQRIGLAQALIHDPKVLILDEPTSGLDPNQLVEIRQLIASISTHKTVILSTHIMQEVEAMCNRVVIIHKGKIVADKNSDELSAEEENAAGIKVEFSKPIDLSLLTTINGVKDASALLEPNTYLLFAAKGIDIRSDIFQFAVKNNVEVLSMNKVSGKLEEIFHRLTT